MKVKKVNKANVKTCLARNWLTIATFAGVIIGIAIGAIIKSCHVPMEKWENGRLAMFVGYIGRLFLQALKSIIIPLVVPSLIVAIGSMDLSLSKKIGGRAIAYYMSTTFVAIVLGIILVTTIQPGTGVSGNTSKKAKEVYTTTADTLMDLVRNLIPPNVFQATMQQTVTALTKPDNASLPENSTIQVDDPYTWMINNEFQDNTNILGLVAWSIILGIAIGALKDDAKPVLDFFVAFTKIMMRITQIIINFAPVGVAFLVAEQIIRMKSVEETFKGLGLYFGTVILGLFIHGLIVLPILYGVIVRKLPFRFIFNMGNALFTAFGTASSSATLPVTIEVLEERNGIDPRITRFVLPIGATINMDGTALYEAVAAIFIAQVRGIQMDLGRIIGVCVTATFASIGAAGIPQAGLVTLIMVLNTVGLPATDAALILSVDWLLDRFRTTINVLGDSIGSGIIDHLSRKELEEMDRESDEATGDPSKADEGHKNSNGQPNLAFELRDSSDSKTQFESRL